MKTIRVEKFVPEVGDSVFGPGWTAQIKRICCTDEVEIEGLGVSLKSPYNKLYWQPDKYWYYINCEWLNNNQAFSLINDAG